MPHPLRWLKEKLLALGRWLKEKLLAPGKWLKEKRMAAPAGPMQSWKAVCLFFYLLIIGGLMVYGVYGLWAAEPKTTPEARVTEPSYTENASSKDDPPKILRIAPQWVTIGVSQASLQIFGYNFTDKSQVKFNDAPRVPQPQYVNEHRLVVPLVSTDFTVPGAVVITVENDSKRSNAEVLTVEAAGNVIGDWRLFCWSIKIRQEVRLILLVLFTGALGACMSALHSLATYLGERKLVESWFTFYLVRPLLGAGIGFIFYLVVRGGFLSGSNFDATTVNPFGVTAVAALVGMFCDPALQKLREVFLTLFKPSDTRANTLVDLSITTRRKLPDAHAGVPYTQKLEASGGSPPSRWASPTPLLAWLTLDPATGQLTGTPPPITSPPITSPPTYPLPAPYTFQVTDSSGASVTAELELTVTTP
jgi:Putative Ig domain